MRTTVTLDADVERLLKDTVHRTRRSFSQTLNDAGRTALAAKRESPTDDVFKVEAHAMGLRLGPAQYTLTRQSGRPFMIVLTNTGRITRPSSVTEIAPAYPSKFRILLNCAWTVR